jgi:hypothetical protein
MELVSFKLHHFLYETPPSRPEQTLSLHSHRRFSEMTRIYPEKLRACCGCVLADQNKGRTAGMTSRKIRKTVCIAHKSHWLQVIKPAATRLLLPHRTPTPFTYFILCALPRRVRAPKEWVIVRSK